MNKRSGHGRHTTLSDSASKVMDIVESIEGVKRIVIGPLFMGQGKKGPWTVKVVDQQGCILLVCYQSKSKQEIRLYVENGNGVSVADSLKESLERNGLFHS